MSLRYLFLSLFFSTFLFAQQKPVVVLELFTSQGCSSCPPADTVLEDIKNTSNPEEIIPLSYHVDYWDYIGWKDPYASKQFTDKQRIYGRKFNSSSIYTPQLVINGKEHIVGSDRVNILKKIEQKLNQKKVANSVKVKNVTQKENTVNFSYQIEGAIKNKNIHFILVLNEKVTNVKRGENSNRTLSNNNIVVKEDIKALTNSEGNYEIKIPKSITKKDALKLVVLISNKGLDINTGTQYNL